MIADFDPADVTAALALARDRSPLGRRMGRFRWAQVEGAVWLFPASLGRIGDRSPLAASVCVASGPLAAPVPFACWLATALRQDIWRALRAVSGLVPLVRVVPDAAAGHVHLTAGALVPAAGAAPAIRAVLDSLLEPVRLRPSITWAQRRAKEDHTGG